LDTLLTMIQGYEHFRSGPVLKIVPNQIRPDAEIAAQELECAVCKYNVEWACQHLDCKLCPGEQRKAGTLKAVIRRVDFRCPLAR
jgi:hypothetical protein